MSLKERLQDDLKTAMKARDEVRKIVVRNIMTEVRIAETAKKQIELDDGGVLAIIQRLAKQREEAIEMARDGGREDIVTKETAELALLLEYLPKQLSREEIEAEAHKIIEREGATGPKDMGRVMGPLMDQLKGQADGKLVSEVVRAILSQQ
jgi:uncharacterized protein YqeY